MQDSKKIFAQILKELDEKELKEFINKYCKTNATMQNKFLTHFAHKIKVKPKEKYQMIIDNCIKACSNTRGYFFINPKKTNMALKPLHKLLKQEQISYHQRPYESYQLAILILENFGAYYEDFYEVQDTDKLDNLFYETIELLNGICESATTPYEFKEEIFQDILDLAEIPYFNKSSSYEDGGVDMSLLRIASELCQNDEQCQEVIEVIDRKIERKDSYHKNDFIAFKIKFLKERKLDDALSKTIDDNMDQEDVRNMVIDTLLQNGDIEKAIELIKDGITLYTQKGFMGIVGRYEMKLLDVYKKSKMEDAYLLLLNKLYRENYSDNLYDLLKRSYSENAWKKEVVKIIHELKTQQSKDRYTYNTSVKLAKIYVKEKMEEELFNLLKKNKYFDFLESFGKYCKENHSPEILRMYGTHINQQLGYSNTRKQYAELAKTLKKLSTTYEGGEAYVGNMYRSIKRQYAKRPAMLEEMSILKHLETCCGEEKPKKNRTEITKKEQKTLF